MRTESTTKGAAAVAEAAHVQITMALSEAEDAKDFLARVDAILSRPESRLELAVDLGVPDPLDPSAKQGSIDSENAISVFEYLGEMDRANAADPRLWTYLAFVTYRSYMEERWPLLHMAKWQNRVQNRWLMTNPNRGRLIRHGIARLWWVTHLTFDPKGQHVLSVDDPYAYTREAFRNEDRILALFDREVGAIGPVVRAMLERAAVGGDVARDQDFRLLMRSLTLVAGYQDVGLIPADELPKLVAQLGDAMAD